MPGSVAAGGRSRAARYRPGRFVIGAALAATLSCGELAGPGGPATPTPWLESISYDDFRTRLTPGGLLYLYGMPADPEFRLQPHQRVPVEALVSSGDFEALGLYNHLCPPREPRYFRYHCFMFGILMEPGRDPSEVGGHVARWGGRMTIPNSRQARIYLFDRPQDVVRRARQAKSWPGVAVSYLTSDGCIAPRCPELAVPVAVNGGSPVPGDGILQVGSGDTLTVSYRQPDGQRLQLRLLVY